MQKFCTICMAVFAASHLGGAEPVSIIPADSAISPLQPQVAVTESGPIYVAFGAEQSIFVSGSCDGGRTYDPPVKIDSIEGLALGMRRGPRIVAVDNNMVVSAIGHAGGNLQAWRSDDGGKSWSNAVQVNDSSGHASEGLHAMAIGPKGQVFCVWLDHRSNGAQIFGARSPDGGKSWSANQRIYASPSGSVCECCHPSAAFGPNGDLYVMWRNSLNGYRDLYFAVSSNGGETFSAAEKLGSGSWKLAACPMDGGSLAVAGERNLTTIWRRDKQVILASSERQSERLLGRGVQPWAAANHEGAYLVWISRREGELWLRGPKMQKPRIIADNASDPVVAASAKGTAVVVWETQQEDRTSIVSLVVQRHDPVEQDP